MVKRKLRALQFANGKWGKVSQDSEELPGSTLTAIISALGYRPRKRARIYETAELFEREPNQPTEQNKCWQFVIKSNPSRGEQLMVFLPTPADLIDYMLELDDRLRQIEARKKNATLCLLASLRHCWFHDPRTN